MKVIACGGRNWTNQIETYKFLDWVEHEEGLINVLIHGDAKGADRLSGMWADRYEIEVRKYPADWAAHGKAAGPIRNRLMLERENPEIVIAFPGGKGTDNMIKQAIAKSIQVIKYEDKKSAI